MKKNRKIKKVENQELQLENLIDVTGGGAVARALGTTLSVLGVVSLGALAAAAAIDHYELDDKFRKRIGAAVQSDSLEEAKNIMMYGPKTGSLATNIEKVLPNGSDVVVASREVWDSLVNKLK